MTLKEKVNQLTLEEQTRAAIILGAIPQVVAAMAATAGPDDSLIAVSAALMTIFGFALTNARPNLCAEVTFEFVVESILARRKKENDLV